MSSEYITIAIDFTGRPGTNKAPSLEFCIDGDFPHFVVKTDDTPNNSGGAIVALDKQAVSRLYYVLKSLREQNF